MAGRAIRRWDVCDLFYFLFEVSLVSLVLLAFLIHPTLTQPAPLRGNDMPKLVLNETGFLTLAIFSDLHFGEEEDGFGIDQDINSTRVMNAVLDAEPSVDMVVLNGDLITGENTFKENSSAYVNQIVAPMVSRQIPWASTYGNHDSKYNLSREAIFQAEKKYHPLSYTQRMMPSLPGITNYYLLVYSSDEQPAAILWFFDSRGGAKYQQGDPSGDDNIPDWVANETAAWFVATSKQIRGQYGRLPSIAFVHIPPHTFLTTQEPTGQDPSHFPGINDDVPVAIEGTGSEDSAFVDALLQQDMLNSVYVGHDHGNAWCGLWPAGQAGPFLCFSRHSGYGGYGTWDRGSRIVQLSFDDLDGDGSYAGKDEMRVETWVRMEDGGVITRVVLNSTYGIDDYGSAALLAS